MGVAYLFHISNNLPSVARVDVPSKVCLHSQNPVRSTLKIQENKIRTLCPLCPMALSSTQATRLPRCRERSGERSGCPGQARWCTGADTALKDYCAGRDTAPRGLCTLQTQLGQVTFLANSARSSDSRSIFCYLLVVC